MAATKVDLSITTTWTNLVSTYSDLASVSAFIQNKGSDEMLVFFSASATAPTGSVGMLLKRGDVAFGTAANIWVRGLTGTVTATCGLTD